MTKLLPFLSIFCTLAACSSKSAIEDADGDGHTTAGGDCWDNPKGPSGTSLSGEDIHPEATETWYDGIDQNCAGDDDYDIDKDGFVPDEHEGAKTKRVDGTGELPAGDCIDDPEQMIDLALEAHQVHPGDVDTWYDGIDQDCSGNDDYDADFDGFVSIIYAGRETLGTDGTGILEGGDCWDDPIEIPPSFVVVSGVSATGDIIAWAQPQADNVHPAAEDVWYDGVDQNCDDGNDFDQDNDGYSTAYYPERSGLPAGDDCSDGDDDVDAITSEDLEPYGLSSAAVHPGVEETWYDGLDQDCGSDDDCDADNDGFTHDGGGNPVCIEDPESSLCDSVVCLPEDCNDLDPSRYPNDDEEIPYNGEDDNCDYSDGDGDADGDGYWASDYDSLVEADGHSPMEVPEGRAGDCDDAIDTVYPGASDTWYDGADSDCGGEDDFDQDLDGYVYDENAGLVTTGVPGSGSLPAGDCNDDPDSDGGDVHPGASDTWYDGIDTDCSGNDDFDADFDGHVSDAHARSATIYVDGSGGLPGGDCDDTDSLRHPSHDEDCGTDWDDDCDEETNDVDATGCTDFYVDDDGDGEGDPDLASCTCEATSTHTVSSGVDCNDGDSTIFPTAVEECDLVDQDCDGSLTDDLYEDEDGDGTPDCADGDLDGDGFFEGEGPTADCDDSDASIYPGAVESCDDVDSDCDGSLIDEFDGDLDDDGEIDCLDSDADGDGFLAESADGDDCDDADASIHPDATEIWYDGTDSNCDSASDYDQDGDGHDSDEHEGDDCDDEDASVNPDAEDRDTTADFDDDCDGLLDEDDVLDAIAAGEDTLIFSELQVTPSPTGGGERKNEWFEVYNASDLTIYLDNWRFRASSDECLDGTGLCSTFTIFENPNVMVEPGEYLLFCLNKSHIDEIISPSTCDYHWGHHYYGPSVEGHWDSSFGLSTGTRTLQMEIEDTVIDEVDYGEMSWPDSTTGASWQVSEDRLGGGGMIELNDDFATWCSNSTSIYDTGSTTPNSGTPGTANLTCD